MADQKSGNEIPKTLLGFIRHFTKPYRKKLFYMVLLSALWALIFSLRPYIIKIIVDTVSKHDIGQGSLFLVLLVPVIFYLVVESIFELSIWVYNAVHMQVIPFIQADIIHAMVAYIEKHSYIFFQNRFSGTIAGQIKDMSKGIRNVIEISIDRFFSHILGFVVAIFMMTRIHPVMAGILSVWILFFVVTSYFFSKRALKLSELLSFARNKTVGNIVDSFTNIMTVRLFSRNKYELRYLDEYLDNQVTRNNDLELYKLSISRIQGISVIFLHIALLGFLVYARQYGLVTVGDFVFALTLARELPEKVWKLTSDFIPFAESLGECRQALTLIQKPHAIVDTSSATQLKVSTGSIDFKNVAFGYSSRKTLFQDLSVSIPGGQRVGLVGFSGSGKSTFVNLILRMFDVQKGSIMIDKQDIRNVTQDSLRQHISYIPQDPLLFHRSIEKNIMYGRPQATHDEMIEAAKKAHAHEFILSYEQGYNTLVGERGIKLSGGQRQRIAIARAFLKNAPILILDEATSALDSETEGHIQDSLEKLVEDRTVIVVAHRLSTLLFMDRILVFDAGEIVEDGTHQALLGRDGRYARLWNAQISGFLPDDGGVDEEISDE